jgi:phosphatidylserine/phosphatidylglycerophosphate/cardiolipin synthase-like enzyme
VIPREIAAQISQCAAGRPLDLLWAAALVLEATAEMAWPQARGAIFHALPHAEFREEIARLLAGWQAQEPAVSRQALAYALAAAAETAATVRGEQSVALVWTGPRAEGPALRNTAQALLEVIVAAERELLLVTFAVSVVPKITQALVEAARRGVTIRIVLETQETGEGQINYDTVGALGAAVRACAQIYVWPAHKRERGANGKPGALHAKCAVADHKLLFLASANLTGHAQTINMELGVMIRGGRLPGDVATQYMRLIEYGVLERLRG